MAAVVIHPTTFITASSPSLFSCHFSKPVSSHISAFLSPANQNPNPNPKLHHLPLVPQSPLKPSISSSPSKPFFPSNPFENPGGDDDRELHNATDFSHLLHLSVRYGDSELARAIHASILKLEGSTYTSNALLVAYLKLGRLTYASRFFRSILVPDVVSYTAMISGLAKSNREREAIELFCGMGDSGIEPNEYTLVALLTACISLHELELGFQVQCFAVKSGFLECTYVVNALMALYSKCGCLDNVIELFNEMPVRDIASWNTVISSLVKEHKYDEAFEYFYDLVRINCLRVDYFTLSSILAACSASLRLKQGRELHAYAIRIGYGGHLSVNNALIGLYRKCGTVEDVVNSFGQMPRKDVITLTEMITAYMEFGLVDLAVETFDRLSEKNSVSFNALLAGYCQNGMGWNALCLFCKMVEEGIELSEFTLSTTLKACALLMEKKTSEQIHGFVLKFGYGVNEQIESALLEMCTWCGRMADAKKMFLRWPLNQDKSIALTSLVGGYARIGKLDSAISLFSAGQSEGSLIIDEVASTSILGLCGSLGFRNFGVQMHCFSIKKGYEADIRLGNATINMYSKCGQLNDAVKVFDVIPCHDISSWNSLLDAYVLHRQGDEALAIWAKMEKLRIKPDSITCVYIISAYKHTRSNLVCLCREFFESMESAYFIKPTSEHYTRLVRVLGQWGLLEEAEQTVRQMPLAPNALVWHALLDGCRVHGNAIVGKRVMKEIMSIEPHDPFTFILKSNLFSASGRWHCSDILREEMRKKGFRKLPSQSWIIHQNKIHSFFARDQLHPESKDIYSGLRILIMECLKAGYEPDTSFVLHEVEEYQKKEFLFYHSAKLAATYGLLKAKPGNPVRIIKNILLCGDCHSFFKHVSVVTKREIHVRDSSGFHCFSNGLCSCNDH